MKTTPNFHVPTIAFPAALTGRAMMINVIAMTRRFICSLQVAPCRIRPCLSTAY